MRIAALLLWLATGGFLLAAGPSAADLFAQGRKAEKAGRFAEAYILYSNAASLAPGNMDYWMRSQAVQSRAALQAKPLPAAAVTAEPTATPASALPPGNPPTLSDIAEARRPLPPTQLHALPGLRDFDIQGDSTKLFQEVSRAFGLECIFDAEYSPGASQRFQLHGVDYRTALHGLEAVTNSFIVPIADRKFLVAKDDAAKRNELEPVVSVEVHLPETLDPKDFTEAITAVQQAMALQKVQWDTQNNTVIIKDRISKVIPARDMFENFMFPPAQVVVEVQLLEVSRNDALTYGVDLKAQFPLTPLTTWLNNKPSLPGVINGLLAFGGGKSLMGIGIINASLVAKMEESSGAVLQKSMLRSLEGQPASLHVGDRFPLLTAGYFDISGAVTPGTMGFIPSFTFEDLGLTVKVTPTVNNLKETTMDIEAEFKVLSGAGVQGMPIISNRSLKSRVRLGFGEWAAVAGLLNAQEAHTITGTPWLSGLPLIGPLFGVRDNNQGRQQVLLLVRPLLLTPPASSMPTWSFSVGSDNKPITPL